MLGMMGSLFFAAALSAADRAAQYRKEETDIEVPGQRIKRAAKPERTDGHPLNGHEPRNGVERAKVREWEQRKRRDALYARHAGKEDKTDE